MSIILETDEVDDGYFTPVASTTLASIFRDDQSNDAAINTSLKYTPPQPKKPEQNKPDDSGASQCVFSCSLLAHEWVQGTHKCKGYVGFALMKTVKTGLSRIILYSPDKSTLSCTTIVPQLEVTLKDAMILLYDDHKIYWGLCFNDKNIEQVKGLLQKEKVTIKKYEEPELKPQTNNFESDEATEETASSTLLEENISTENNDKLSILNRIANVGHAILPSLPGSPVKKTINILDTSEHSRKSDSADILNVSPSISNVKNNLNNNTGVFNQDIAKSIAIQATQDDTKTRSILSNNVNQCTQSTITSLPLLNNQIFTYVNGYMVPLHMQVPVINNIENAETSLEFELIIQKLTHLKGIVQALEMKNNLLSNQKEVNTSICKNQNVQNNESQKDECAPSDIHLKNISDLENLIKEKDDIISKLQNEVESEIKKTSSIVKDRQCQIAKLNELVEQMKQDISIKNEELKQRIAKKDADMLLASTVKSLMNDTFRSLASNFDSDISYDGNSVKAVLAAVIKKKTVESLSTLFNNQDTTTSSNKVSD